MVRHRVVLGNAMRLAEGLQVVAATQVLEIFIVDRKIGCEHGRGDLTTVGTIADEGVDQAWTLSWLAGLEAVLDRAKKEVIICRSAYEC